MPDEDVHEVVPARTPAAWGAEGMPGELARLGPAKILGLTATLRCRHLPGFGYPPSPLSDLATEARVPRPKPGHSPDMATRELDDDASGYVRAEFGARG